MHSVKDILPVLHIEIEIRKIFESYSVLKYIKHGMAVRYLSPKFIFTQHALPSPHLPSVTPISHIQSVIPITPNPVQQPFLITFTRPVFLLHNHSKHIQFRANITFRVFQNAIDLIPIYVGNEFSCRAHRQAKQWFIDENKES